MDTLFVSERAQPVKFLNNISPPMRRLELRLEQDMYKEIVEIGQYEAMDISATLRELVRFALRYYKFKRGTLNESLPQNTKTFYCQVCGQLTSTRRKHTIPMLNEEYCFCEPCFFADRYKTFIITLLNRL